MDPDELLEIARQLVELGAKNGVTMRILGHLAVRQHVVANRDLISLLKRVPTHDIDFLGYSKEINQANKLFIDMLGYKPDPAVAFSQEYGVGRLIYYHPNGVMAEIFCDELKMAHTIDFRGRLELDTPTINLVDLFLSKLQIVQITEKDIKDLIVLLVEHDLGANDRDKIDVEYMVKLLRDNWGFYYTVISNLEKVRLFTKEFEIIGQENQRLVESRLDSIIGQIESAPKTFKWKARARIGTRVQWYEDVDDVHR